MSYASNDKAYFDYEILEKFEAGLKLNGTEVKSIRANRASIKGSYIRLLHQRPYLVGATISPYQQGNQPENYDQLRNRALLLNKKELAEISRALETKGLTVVPLKIYDKHGMIKLEIGIARGKKNYDKRESIKKRDTEREARRSMMTK